MRKILFALILFFIYIPISADVSHTLSGDTKWYLYSAKPAKNTEIFMNTDSKFHLITQMPLRLRYFLEAGDIFSMEISAAITPSYEQIDMANNDFFTPTNGEYRAVDLPESSDLPWTQNGEGKLYYNLDRANMTFSMPFADLIVGRQAINFGVGKYTSPTDLYSPFSVQEIDKENRRGVDAVRMRIPFLDMNEIDVGWVFGENADIRKSSAFVRTHLYFFKTDMTILFNYFKTNLMTGVSLTRSFGGVGFWVEGAYTAAGVFDERKPDEDFVGITTGIDYQFTKRPVYMFLEYHFNSAGELHAENYFKNHEISMPGFSQSGKTAYNDGAVYLSGQHYITWGAILDITSLIKVYTLIVFNANDPSAAFIKQLSVSLTDDVVWDLGFNSYFGKRMSKPSNGFPEMKSEFGTYPLSFYTTLKWYF